MLVETLPDRQVTVTGYLAREPEGGLYPHCPGFGNLRNTGTACEHAGKWGAGGKMPPGHIWQWRDARHASGYLAHIPEEDQSVSAAQNPHGRRDLESQIQNHRAAIRRLERKLADAERKLADASRPRYGVHIDEAGRYWMHRPDGWHYMWIESNPRPSGLQPYGPQGRVQRLVEPKGR